MEKLFVLSNNPMVWKDFQEAIRVVGKFRDVLVMGRDYIHQGSKLINHPMTGGFKPNQMPYKSLLLSTGEAVPEFRSLHFIESAIANTDSTPVLNRMWKIEVDLEFQFIDRMFLEEAIRGH